VGSPPLKILVGLTCPNPAPWAKTPDSWPSVGLAGGGAVEVWATGVGLVVDGAAVVAGTVAVAVAVAAAVAGALTVAAGPAVACGVAEHPVTAARLAATIAAVQIAARRGAAVAVLPPAGAHRGPAPAGGLPPAADALASSFMAGSFPRRGQPSAAVIHRTPRQRCAVVMRSAPLSAAAEWL
jgi:hypothetical protein